MRILSKTEAKAGTSSVSSFGYDNLDRLISLRNSNGHTESFNYDFTDNLTFYDVEKGTYRQQESFIPQTMNRVRQFTYDNDGNIINDGEASCTCDAESFLQTKTNFQKNSADAHIGKANVKPRSGGSSQNRLKSIPKNPQVSYLSYDGLSRLVSINENGKLTKYRWCDQIKPCLALNADNTVKARFYPQGEFINNATPSKRYYLKDHLGTVQDVVSETGAKLWSGEYSAYGQLMSSTGTAANAPQFGYAGMFKHYGSGLNLTYFRAYNPNTGRWLSTDPIGFNGGRNLYGYVGGSPINNNDSLGLDYWVEDADDDGKALHQRVCVGESQNSKYCISFAANPQDYFETLACALLGCYGEVYKDNGVGGKISSPKIETPKEIDDEIKKMFIGLEGKVGIYNIANPFLGSSCRGFSQDVYNELFSKYGKTFWQKLFSDEK